VSGFLSASVNQDDHQTKHDIVDASLTSSLGSSLTSHKRVRRDDESYILGLSDEEVAAITYAYSQAHGAVSVSEKRGLLDGILAKRAPDSASKDDQKDSDNPDVRF
jgi:hypothetical protein